MVRIAITLSLALSVSLTTTAQYDNEPVEFEMPDRLNTIGVNLTPAATLIFGAESIRPRFSVNYKRQRKPWQKWRFQLNYEVYDFYDNVRDDLPLNYTDTTITFLYESRDHWRTDFRFGTEFFKANKATSMVYGFDVLVGFRSDYDKQRTAPFWYDPELQGNVPSPFVVPVVLEQTIQYAYTGIDFSIGQRLQAPNNFNFTIIWTPEFIYSWPINETYTDPLQRFDVPGPELEFRLRGLELLLHYVF